MPRKKLSAEELPEKMSEINSWERRDTRIFRRFNFENFNEALDFVNKIAVFAEELDHHPDICFGWGYAEISVTTHDAGGLTARDFELAKRIDAISE